ncbi:MAG: AMP-binding protein [Bacteroidales bacterium]|nr:AMP-binding protein [Bacteroidales bacterium]
MIQKDGKNAIVYKDKTYTFNQLLQYSHCYSNVFQTYHPQRILIFGDNCPEWIFAFYGTLRSHAVAVPLDSQSTVDEVAYVIDDCRPDLIFATQNKVETLQAALQSLKIEIPVFTSQNIDIQNIESEPICNFDVPDLNQTALIIYTSGTTGLSKGVMLSYKNVLFNINAVSKDVPIFNKDRNVMILLPLHHAFPLIGSLMAPIYVGATTYIAEGLNAESILSTLNRGKIGIIIGVPRLYELLAKGVMTKINTEKITKAMYKLADALKFRAFSKLIFTTVHKKFGGHLEYLVSGGAALSVETAKVYKALGFYVLDGYGMTETSPMISFTRPGAWKIGYAGAPLTGIEVQSIDGEICVKGDNVMQGYFNHPEETEKVIIDGWLHTGDIGEVTKYGLKLTGRLKEVLVTSNGKNIIPDELERKIFKSSALIKEVGVFMHEEVLQALVYPEMTQIRQSTDTDINELVKKVIADFNATVSPYKRIKRFHLISEELPKNRLGKIQRFKLASMITQRKQIHEDTKQHSEQYLLLKSFVEKETGYIAGEHDHFEIDLAMDSLSRVAMMAYIEMTFGIRLNESQLENLTSLATLSAYIEQHSQNTINKETLSWKEILSAKIPDFKLPQSGTLHTILNNFYNVALSLLYRYKNKGVSNIPDRPCIFVANHQSMLDAPLILSRMRRNIYRKTYFFAKSKHFRGKVMQSLADKNNVILMDINQNLREALQKLSYALQNGKNIVIFPEGTRSKNGKMNEFKEMFAILSKELNIPVVPVVIQGSGQAVYSKIKLPKYLASVSVEFLKPVLPKENESFQDLKVRVKTLIAERLRREK